MTNSSFFCANSYSTLRLYLLPEPITIIMKKHQKLSLHQLPEDLKQEQEQELKKLILSKDATPEEQLYAINHYLPKTRNLPENLIMLRHLGVSEKDIAKVLDGGMAMFYGELASLKHPTVKVVCSYSTISLDETSNGNYEVCIEGKPIEVYIRQEKERQEQMTNELTERSKEDLMKEIKMLRRNIKRLSERLQDAERGYALAMQLNEMYQKSIGGE